MSSRWLQREHEASAADRILDAAGSLFVTVGVARTNMGDVADAAGCSRSTLYRYFVNRDALRNAFINRTARRLQREVTDEVAHLSDPGERVVEGIIVALHRVRTDPELAALWEPSAVPIASDDTQAVVEELAAAIVGDIDNPAAHAFAMWLVRVVVAFLMMPGESEAAEREMLRSFVEPAIGSLAAAAV